MSTFLITGGAGFIGSNLVREILEKGEKVRVLDNFSTGKRENLSCFTANKDLEVIDGDIRSLQTVRSAVKGTDFILHHAALPSVWRSVKDPLTTNEVNILGTLNVLEAAREFRVKRVVYASSSSVYGDSPSLPKSEDMPVRPLSPYALSKYAAERYCEIYYDLYGVATVCLRYFNVFGPNQDPTSEYSAAIPKFVRQIRQNERPVIYGDGLQSRDFTYVANIVHANLLACEADHVAGQVFNIACGQQHTIRELVGLINRALKVNIEPKFAQARKGDVTHSLADIRKATTLLGYGVLVGFEEGLMKLLEEGNFNHEPGCED